MSDLSKRGRALEDKYSQDQETLFKIESRAARFLGEWLVTELNVPQAEQEEFVGNIITSNMKTAGMDDVLDYVRNLLQPYDTAPDMIAVEKKLADCLADAEISVKGQSAA